jgi:hypothetical protein
MGGIRGTNGDAWAWAWIRRRRILETKTQFNQIRRMTVNRERERGYHKIILPLHDNVIRSDIFYYLHKKLKQRTGTGKNLFIEDQHVIQMLVVGM